MNKFKVLLVYPNLMFVTQLPNNIALLAACLKKANNDVRVFDTTLYKTAKKTVDDARVERLQVRPFNIKDAGLKIKKQDVYSDFRNKVNEYKPNLIGVSVLDDTVKMGLDLIKKAKCNIPVIFGGIYSTFNADKLINENVVDFVCIGEGEKTLVELCDCLKNKKSYTDIKNLWIKNKNKIIKNNLRKPIDINNIPFEDYSVFEEKRLFRPMQGKMVASIPLNFDRGCPYKCSFCNAPAIYNFYKESNFNYYRTKSIERIYKEIKYQIKKYPDLSYFYFNSETFLNRPLDELKNFGEMYSEFKIPFWCQSHINTITDDKIKILKKVGCDRISIGIEHGNDEFRKDILNKKFSNKQVINAFKILNKNKMNISVNNIIGFPDETRQLIFDTINLNRQIKMDSLSGFVFQPYRGTHLREYCIQRGYLKDDDKTDNLIGNSILNMPQLPKEEIEGLLRTFVLYVKLSKRYYPRIREAEQLDETGDEVFLELRQILHKSYFKEDKQ